MSTRILIAVGLLSLTLCGVAQAQALDGNWNCNVQPSSGQAYQLRIRIAANAAQVNNGPALPITASGTTAEFAGTRREGGPVN